MTVPLLFDSMSRYSSFCTFVFLDVKLKNSCYSKMHLSRKLATQETWLALKDANPISCLESSDIYIWDIIIKNRACPISGQYKNNVTKDQFGQESDFIAFRNFSDRCNAILQSQQRDLYENSWFNHCRFRL